MWMMLGKKFCMDERQKWPAQSMTRRSRNWGWRKILNICEGIKRDSPVSGREFHVSVIQRTIRNEETSTYCKLLDFGL